MRVFNVALGFTHPAIHDDEGSGSFNCANNA
jgi:hypothetical protein